MNLFDWFKNRAREYKYARMLSGYTPIFTQFGTNVYASDVVQQAIYSIVTEIKKLRPQHLVKKGMDVDPKNDAIQRVLENPNPLMTQSDFLEKITWLVFLNYNAFIFPTYDPINGQLKALWPLNPSQVDFLQDSSSALYVCLHFPSGDETTIPYDHLIHLKYRYSINEFMGGNENGQPDNDALLKTLELNDTLLQGVGKALKSSFSINGVVKYNTLMDAGKTEAAIKELEQNLQNNTSGFLPLDLKGEFIPFQKQIQLVDEQTLRFIDSKILRHYGVPLSILTGDYTTEQLAAFYQKTLEPLIISLGQAFTRALFTPQARAMGHCIEFFSEELIFMNSQQKLEMVRLLGDSGTLYENEKRRIFGLTPLPELVGVRLQSLNYVNVDIAAQYQLNQPQQTNSNNQPEEKENE